MGMHFKDIKYFEEITDFLEYKTFDGLKLCLIGDLFIRRDLHEVMKHRWVSKYFQAKGFEVSVIDLGIGTEIVSNTTLKYDLSKPLPEGIGKFDFIVDFGTAEHILNQYEFNKNMHGLCNVNGVMIRSNPSDTYGGGSAKKHHGYFHYTPNFYIKLSNSNKYKIVDIREMAQKYWGYGGNTVARRKNFTYVTLLKGADNEFMSNNQFKIIEGELGDYPK